MKKKVIYGLLLAAVISVVLFACTKENPISPVAAFTTSLSNNHAYGGEAFAVYLKNVKGDYITIFTGDDSTKIYSPNSVTALGNCVKTGIDKKPDSIMITYSTPGTYTFTMLVSSTGNQSKDYEQKTSSIQITVSDRRNSFTKFTIDKIDGQLSEDGTHIFFYSNKAAVLSSKKPSFQVNTQSATVTVGGVLQSTGSSLQDFSALNPGDSLGRPVEYVVTANDGTAHSYIVQYKLRDPFTEKVLVSLAVSNLGSVFIPDELNKNVEILYLAGTNLVSSKVKGNVSLGASALIGTKNISDKETVVNLGTSTAVTVKAEDGTTQDYAIIKTVIEKITSFSFIKSAGNDLNPAPVGTIDYTTKTININVLAGTDRATLVANFAGLTSFTAQVGATVITSGATVLDYSTPVVIDLYSGSRKLDSYTVIVSQVSK